MDRIDPPTRDRIAAIIVGIALAVALATVALGRYESGVRLTTAGEYVVVSEVQGRSVASQFGLRPGMIVTELGGVTLVRLPTSVWPETEPTPDPLTGEVPPYEPIGIEPAVPTIVDIDPAGLAQLLSRPVISLSAIERGALSQPVLQEIGPTVQLYDDGLDGIRQTMPLLVVGLVLLLATWWWMASGRAGEALRGLAAPLAVATAMPFIVKPLDATQALPLATISMALLAAGMLPLAHALIERIDDPEDRRLVTIVAGACAAAAVVIGVVASTTEPWYGETPTRLALIGAIALIPGLAAAGPIRRASGAGSLPTSGRLMESTEYAVIGLTPAVALASSGAPLPLPLTLWFLLILLAGRFTIRPLARLATRAALQRDLVVAATEAERARVAADIHDDALQELTLLVHRLDAAGDEEGAGIARTVSDRLRAICGDLRLPILDDLGVGPALDWLVLRIERLAGGEVRLERADGTRPPADVELAFFRVAQEALANAVKHGRPPILVRYSTTPGGASLSIDDAGPGIEPDAGAPDGANGADQAGHFGLLNMQQRAEAIGAILDVRRWPAGGTHVALEWRAH
ncbi:MAG: ATP-binding protein [Chloroflexota bacterium]